MQLVRQEDGRVVWRGEITADDEIEIFNADMEYTVQAMSEILRRKMERFIRQIDLVFLNLQRPAGIPELVESPADAVQVTQTDTDTSEPVVPDYYELVPGKIVPE